MHQDPWAIAQTFGNVPLWVAVFTQLNSRPVSARYVRQFGISCNFILSSNKVIKNRLPICTSYYMCFISPLPRGRIFFFIFSLNLIPKSTLHCCHCAVQMFVFNNRRIQGAAFGFIYLYNAGKDSAFTWTSLWRYNCAIYIASSFVFWKCIHTNVPE
jgi:hypothetical protein